MRTAKAETETDQKRDFFIMATSKLQEYTARLLEQYFPEYAVRENYRPDWMMSKQGKRLELDFYVEKLNIAIEIQGKQHYTFIKFFHKNEEGFSERLADDREKKRLCRNYKVTLFEASNEQEVFEIIKKVKAELRNNYVEKEGFQEWKTMQILKDKKANLKSKQYSLAFYMYYHFLEDGTFYPKENKTFHFFYQENQAVIDDILNKKFKDQKTERRLKAFNKI